MDMNRKSMIIIQKDIKDFCISNALYAEKRKRILREE